LSTNVADFPQLLEHSVLANEVLRRFCQSLQLELERLKSDIRQFKIKDPFAEEINDEIARQKQKRKAQKSQIVQLKQLLETQENRSARHHQRISQLKRQTEQQKQQIESYESQITHQQELSDQDKQTRVSALDEAHEAITNLTNTNSQLKETVERLTGSLRDRHAALESETQTVQELSDELNRVQSELKQCRHQYHSEMKDLKANMVQLFDQTRAESNDRITTAEALNAQYELTVSELETRLSESRQQLSAYYTRISDLENENRELSATAKSTRIDSKIDQMRFATFEEKVKREQSLFESQMKLRLFNSESARIREVENIKMECEKTIRVLLVQISKQFRAFFDCNERISQESTVKLLGIVSLRLSDLETQLNNAKSDSAVLHSIAELVNVSDISQLPAEIEELSAIRKSFEKLAPSSNDLDFINHIKDELLSWETWGKRMAAIVLDGFACVKRSHAIRNSLEEVLLTAIGQKTVCRRTQILRIEKQFLLQGAATIQSRGLSLNSIALVIRAVLKLRKLSGHESGLLEFTSQPFVIRSAIQKRSLFRSV
jgi:type VII secretion effector (TIGR04197 family)